MKHLAVVVALTLPAIGLATDTKKPQAGQAAAAAGVHWEGQVVKATGSGAPDMKATSPAQARLGAERAAQMDAFRNLLAQVKGIQVSGGKTVADEMEKDELRGKVEGVIRGYRVTDKRYFSDQGVEIDVEVPLAALTEVFAAPSGEALAVKTDGEKKNTGLVVDATGLEVSPALSPRLLDNAGKAVYAVDCLTPEARRAGTVATYVKGLDAAMKSEKAGKKPLVVKAIKVAGSDLVLNPDAVKTLMAQNNSYLAEGRVVIVTK